MLRKWNTLLALVSSKVGCLGSALSQWWWSFNFRLSALLIVPITCLALPLLGMSLVGLSALNLVRLSKGWIFFCFARWCFGFVGGGLFFNFSSSWICFSHSLLYFILTSSDYIINFVSDIVNLCFSIKSFSHLFVCLNKAFKFLLKTIVLIVKVCHMFI